MGTNKMSSLPGAGGGLKAGEVLRLRFSPLPAPSIQASCRGCDFMNLHFDVRPGDYRPCLLLHNMETSLKISMSTSSIDLQKSQSSSNEWCTGMLGKMWQDRDSFSDCAVVCADHERTYAAHRIVLATASPVWRAALQSEFSEGREARIVIQDADPSVVEALLCYAYTGDFQDTDLACC